MSQASSIFAAAAAEAFCAKEVLHVDQWADRHRVVPAKVSKLHGKWNTDLTPYLRRPMRCFTHTQVRRITEMLASQTGKTEGIENMKLFSIDCAPANCMVMFGDIETARNFNEDRFLPAVRECPRVRRHLLPSAHDTKAAKINFDNMTMYFFGSNSAAGRRGNPIPNLFFDEIGTYGDPDWEEAYDRVKGGDGTHKIVETSTPDDEDVGIDKFWKLGSMEHFWVPCPHCGVFQRLIFKGLTWEGGGSATPDQAAHTARYVCQNKECGHPCYEFHKKEMLARGVWVPKSRTVADVVENGEGSVAGTGKGQCTGIEQQHVSFQLSSLYSPFPSASWGEMAKKFVEARGVMTRSFVRGWLGEPWKVPGDKLEIGELARLCMPADKGGYRLGEVPEGVLAIIRGIDVQKDHVWVVDRGFGVGGRDTWLIDFRRIPRKEGNNLLDVWPQLKRGHRRIGSKEVVPIAREFVDSGHFTDEVYKGILARRIQGVRARCVIGRLKSSPLAAPFTSSAIDRLADGTPIKGMPERLVVNSDHWKVAVTSRIRGTEEEGGISDVEISKREEGNELEGVVEARGDGEVGGFFLPEMDSGGRMTEYIEQVTSEQRVIDRGKKGDRHPKYEWKLKPGRQHNHAFDCECYIFCGAESVQVRMLGRRKKS